VQYQVKKLQGRHRRMVRGILLGQKNKDIAKQLGVTPQSVSIVKNSLVAMEKMDELNDKADAKAIDVATQIQQVQAPALELLTKVVKGDEDVTAENGVPINLRVKTALSLMASGGHGPVRRIDAKIDGNVNVYTRQDLDAMRRRALAEAKRRGMVIDVPYSVGGGNGDGQPKGDVSEGAGSEQISCGDDSSDISAGVGAYEDNEEHGEGWEERG